MNLVCARKQCICTARVFLKSAFGKAVGVLWDAHHQPTYPTGKPNGECSMSVKVQVSLTIGLRLRIKMKCSV